MLPVEQTSEITKACHLDGSIFYALKSRRIIAIIRIFDGNGMPIRDWEVYFYIKPFKRRESDIEKIANSWYNNVSSRLEES